MECAVAGKGLPSQALDISPPSLSPAVPGDGDGTDKHCLCNTMTCLYAYTYLWLEMGLC